MNTLPIKIKNGTCAHVEIITYPDGQKNVVLDMEYFNNPKMIIQIKASIRNFAELEILLCIVAALKKADFVIAEIKYIYMFGLRSDRAFKRGMPNYFRDVLAPILDSIDCLQWGLMVPHSKLAAYTCKSQDIFDEENKIIMDLLYKVGAPFLIKGDENAPLRHWAASFQKTRDSNGHFKISMNKENLRNLKEKLPKYSKNPIIIFDDLCDGGGTFIEEAKILKEHFPDIQLNLFVVHGLFTKGIDILLEHFEIILCTNSYQDIDHPRIIQCKVI